MNSFDKAILDLMKLFNGYGTILFTLITIVISGFLSSIIGLEREMKGQAAGLRTHVLVSIGCCFLMSISVFLTNLAAQQQVADMDAIASTNGKIININLDISRIAAGILSGIGFMGAGTIIKNGLNVKGLTTATTIWCCSAIGMACGIGFVLEAIIATAVIFFVLIGLQKLEIFLDKMSPRISVLVRKNIPIFQDLRSMAEKFDLNIKNISSHSVNKPQTILNQNGEEVTEETQYNEITLVFPLHASKSTLQELVETFKSNPYVEEAKVVSK